MTPPPPARRPAPAAPTPTAPAFSPGSGAERLADETRERFLREIVARVPAERAVECFLFPPIRQGGVESGIAVIAVRREGAVEAAAEPTLVDLTPDGDPTEAAALDPVVPQEEAITADGAAPAALTPADAQDVPDAARSVDTADSGETRDTADGAGAPGEPGDAHADAPVAAADDAAAGGADGDRPEEVSVAVAVEAPADVPADAPADAPGDTSVEAPAGPPAPGGPTFPPERHTVFVARYRLTVKGPERGRWEVDVREEADAPLVTVAEVVRGVGRRAGDAADPTRLDGGALATLALPALPRLPVAPGAAGR